MTAVAIARGEGLPRVGARRGGGVPSFRDAAVHGQVVAELRVLRERGLMRLRRLTLPTLALLAADATGAADGRAVEALLRQAVAALGEEEIGRAAGYLFGLVPGTIGRRGSERREAAAAIYGVAAETFRKEPERLLLERVAEEVIRLAPPRTRGSTLDPPGGGAASVAALGVQQWGVTGAVRRGMSARAPGGREARAALVRALARAQTAAGTGAPLVGPIEVRVAGEAARVVVEGGGMEELRGVALLVSSENTYLQPSPIFARTLSGQLRNAAAVRDASGAVTEDPVAEQLEAWLVRHGRRGLPVEPGVVVPTSPGVLARRGVQRILHAAVACPLAGSGGFDVPDLGVRRAVRECFALARLERRADPRVSSIAFPLLGAGGGGLTPQASIGLLWPTIRDELAQDPGWQVHLCAWTPAEAVPVLQALLADAG